MLRPNHPQSALPRQGWTSRSIAAAIGVGVVHLLFIYGLLSGLATRAVQSLPHIIDVRILDATLPAPSELPPPPVPDLAQPKVEFVPPPEIRIAAPAAPNAITAIRQTKPLSHPPAAAPAKPAVPAPTPPRSIASTHTIPPYPPLSRRLGEEGTVELKLAIGTDGRVQKAMVEKSSGSERLDEAAREWVERHWRYYPATRDGKPVAAETHVRVVFNLKSGRV